MADPTRYPDIADILARKTRGRRMLAAQTFTQKLAALERLRERARAVRAALRTPAEKATRTPKSE